MTTPSGSVYKDTRPKRDIDRSWCTYIDKDTAKYRCKKDDRIITPQDDVDVPKGFKGKCVQCMDDFEVNKRSIDIKTDAFLENHRKLHNNELPSDVQLWAYMVNAQAIVMGNEEGIDPNYIVHTKLLWFVEEVGEFLRTFRKDKPIEDVHEEWIDVLFFWLHVASLLQIDIDTTFGNKFDYNSKRGYGRPNFVKATPEEIDEGIKGALEDRSSQDLDSEESAEKFLDKVEERMQLEVTCPQCGMKVTINAKDAMNFMCPNRKCPSHAVKEIVEAKDKEPMKLQRPRRVDPKDPMGVPTEYEAEIGPGLRMESSVVPSYICGFCDKDFGIDKQAYDDHMITAGHVRTPSKADFDAAEKRIAQKQKGIQDKWG